MTSSTTHLFSKTTAVADLTREGASVEVSKRHSGAWIDLPSGWTVSVQWDFGNYCDNYNGDRIGAPNAPDSTTAEVALWRTDSKADLVRWADGDTVQGWQTWDQVQRLIDLAADNAVPRPVTLS